MVVAETYGKLGNAADKAHVLTYTAPAALVTAP
jgi:hypothetical protein